MLTWHQLTEEVSGSATISPEAFRKQIQALSDAGCNTISLEQLRDYVYNGTPLPAKPIVLTFDDGYLSNYADAFPVLKEYNMKATIFAIGVSIGKDTYKDTDHAMTPHFGAAEMQEMVDSGLISIQSHTYDMHQWPPFEDGNDHVRETLAQLPGESDADYEAAVRLIHSRASRPSSRSPVRRSTRVLSGRRIRHADDGCAAQPGHRADIHHPAGRECRSCRVCRRRYTVCTASP